MQDKEQEFSFKRMFFPLTTIKAIHIIIAVGFIVFGNMLFNGFVSDDQLQVVDNSIIHSLQNLPTFFSGGTFYQGSQHQSLGYYYRPLLSTTYSIIYSFFGANAFAYHLFQMLLYIGNACIVFLIFKHFFKKSIALVLSVIFLVHPINSETALYIADTQEVLFFFFGCLSLLILQLQQSKKNFLVVGMLLLCSLFAKETGVLFIFLTIIYMFVFRQKNSLIFSAYAISSLFIYFILRLKAINMFIHWTPIAPIEKLNLLNRMMNVPEITFFYIKTFLFPLNLSSSYLWVYTNITLSNFFLPFLFDVLFFAVLIFLAVLLFRKYPRKYFMEYLFFLLWFSLGLVVHLQIIPLDQTVAERWFYFPIIGLLGICGVLSEIQYDRFLKKKFFVFVILIIVLLSFRTFFRTFDWRNNLTLATQDSKTFNKSYDLENKIGTELLKQGRFEEAKIHLKKSVELFPSILNYSNLGIAYANLGEYKEAKESFDKALSIGNNNIIYENLASLYILTESPKKTIDFVKSALKKYPQDPKLWEYLAVTEYKNGNIEDAKASISKAYLYNKNSEISNIYSLIMNNQPLNLNYNTK